MRVGQLISFQQSVKRCEFEAASQFLAQNLVESGGGFHIIEQILVRQQQIRMGRGRGDGLHGRLLFKNGDNFMELGNNQGEQR